MILLDGKKVSNEIIEELILRRNKIKDKIKLAIIWVGNDSASEIYIKNKQKKCEKVGIETELFHLDSNITEEYLINLIDNLNKDKAVSGILLQSPVPKTIDIIKCFNEIDYHKDVDGFSCISVGSLYLGREKLVSCTPKGIIRLLDYYNIDLKGKNVCLINRSNIVGKPLFHLLMQRGATVTVCHSLTKNIKEHTLNADIIISAVGKPKFITSEMVSDGAIIIDVGISRVDGHVVGDVDFDNVKDKCSYITPVPGGIGPMTVAMMIENILEAKENENG